MPTISYSGKRVGEVELLDVFPPYEGMISQYYGRIGSGKTYNATSDILDLLRRGQVVYANWKIHFDGYDERNSFIYLLRSIIFPWKKRFFYFPPDNLREIEVNENFHDRLGKLTDCHIFLDEGHVAFDSYEMARMSLEKRKNVLHTRHFNRSIHIISQRPTAVHVAMRANVNCFYKCEQLWRFGNLVRFKRTEYQDMLNENVDENDEKIISEKWYWGKKRVFDAYNTKYLRGGLAASQKVLFEAYDLPYYITILRFFRKMFRIKEKPKPIKLKVVCLSPYYHTLKSIKINNEKKKRRTIKKTEAVEKNEPVADSQKLGEVIKIK
jgi:hypothetical protein